MEFVLLVFGLVTFNIAWRARGEARHLRKLIDELRAEMAALRGNSAAVRQPASAPVPVPAGAPPQSAAAFAPAATSAPQPQSPQAAPLTVPLMVLTPIPASASVATAGPAAATIRAPLAPTATHATPATAATASTTEASAEQPPARTSPPATPAIPTTTPPTTPAAPTPPRAPQPPPKWLLAAKSWLFGGNLVAKLGLLILFIGVSFLLKYTAARVTLPIELRLAAIVLVDLAALVWAWRIRLSRPAISLPVQGAALAVLMLVTFGAFRVYHLIPGGMAFALLLVLTVFTCVLAVLQNAMWLAIFGIAGGFATPILASSGGGSHIGLFSYYALLNGGVLALALLRSWRPLNLLGFAFTFSIATAWGVLRYEPDNYLSVQLFLLLFFAFYVSIPLAYARQQAVQLKHYVDGTLVFGTPMLAFGLQYSLVRNMEFGIAYSALALGLFYVALATVLHRQPQHAQRYGLLADSFLALGIVFGTLAIPFALDGRWTSAAWALEGAGIVWIGLRQQQRLAWVFGLLVQVGAWISFIGSATGLSPVSALDANLWLGFLLLAATAFLMATRFRAHSNDGNDGVQHYFGRLAGVFLGFATVWLVAGAWTEILLRVPEFSQGTLLVGSAMIAVIGLYLIARKMAWPLAGAMALAVQAVAGFKLLQLATAAWLGYGASSSLLDRPLLGALMIFVAALFSSWALRRQQEDTPGAAPMYRVTLCWSALWWFALAAPDLADWLARHYAGLSGRRYAIRYGLASDLQLIVYGVLLAATALVAVTLARRLRWPALRWFAATVWPALTGATLLMLSALYTVAGLPRVESWIAFAALWLAAEWLLAAWPRQGWTLRPLALSAIHTVRTAGPWLMIWPVVAHVIGSWLAGGADDNFFLVDDWSTSASWARFVPSWLMMGAIAWMMRRSRIDAWPVTPIAAWYRSRLIPVGCAWSALLVAAWNLTQDGAMAPLPYLPLLNPLDLSTCFVVLLLLACHRLQATNPDAQGGLQAGLQTRGPAGVPAGWPAGWIAPLPLAIALFGYAWFNLALLRTVSHYLGVPYEFASMFASQFVQAMLSLVWSVTALLMMRYAARRTLRSVWIGGAVLLGLAVAKLFLVDLSNIGGVERIVSFLGVGALMVGIGYLAPFPQSEPSEPAQVEPV